MDTTLTLDLFICQSPRRDNISILLHFIFRSHLQLTRTPRNPRKKRTMAWSILMTSCYVYVSLTTSGYRKWDDYCNHHDQRGSISHRNQKLGEMMLAINQSTASPQIAVLNKAQLKCSNYTVKVVVFAVCTFSSLTSFEQICLSLYSWLNNLENQKVWTFDVAQTFPLLQ